jgi:hypothetical protein
VKSLRWSALPAALMTIIVVALVLRIDIVMRRSTAWQGDGCVAGPYDPSERTYLWVITIMAALTLVVAALIGLMARTARLRVVMAIFAIPVLLFSTGYLFFVWTGGETTNRPNAISHCHFG